MTLPGTTSPIPDPFEILTFEPSSKFFENILENPKQWCGNNNFENSVDTLPTEDELEAIRRLRKLGEQIDSEKDAICFLREGETMRKSSLSRLQTNILKLWYFANHKNPYPSKKIKAELIRVSGLTPVQFRNWFTNIRKRRWIPLQRGDRRPKSTLEMEISGLQSSSKRCKIEAC